MTTPEDLRHTAEQLAGKLNQFADDLDRLMPAIAKFRQAIMGITPAVAARLPDGDGRSPDELDAQIAAETGLELLEAARRRLLDVLHDPWDDVRRALQE